MAQFISGLAVALSLMLALEKHPPANIARYLWLVLAEVPFLWSAHFAWGDWSWKYAATYVSFTCLIIYAIGRITADSLEGRRYVARVAVIALILALCFTKLASTELHGQYAWVALGQGFLLLWCGCVTAFAGAYRPRRDLYVPLGLFWCAQALWNFGWSIHGKMWESVNWLIPPLGACACFTYLAWRLAYRTNDALSPP